MRNIFTLFILFAFSLYCFSQTEVTVSTGAGYINEVYYNFDDSVLQTSPRADWDIAFTGQTLSVSVLANSGAGVMVYTYSKGTIDDWASVDTTGMEWNPLYNSIESWEVGAFNRNSIEGELFDYGWGKYNITDHHIYGDSLFIVALSDTVFKKLAIVEKDAPSNKFMFKYADLDGSNEVKDTITANDYSTSFVHYSMSNGEVVSHEPDGRWQLLFTNYFDYTVPHSVSGILANTGVSVQEVKGANQSEFEDYNMELFNDTISQIGWDWKELNFSTFQYEVLDDIVYFVQDTLDGKEVHPVWKIYFTAFGGSANGNYTFMQKNLTEATNVDVLTAQHHISVYPNPVNNQINIIHDFNGEIEIFVYNSSGRLLLKEVTSGDSGLNNHKFDVDFLPTGIYNIVIRSGNELQTTKFLKR